MTQIPKFQKWFDFNHIDELENALTKNSLHLEHDSISRCFGTNQHQSDLSKHF